MNGQLQVGERAKTVAQPKGSQTPLPMEFFQSSSGARTAHAFGRVVCLLNNYQSWINTPVAWPKKSPWKMGQDLRQRDSLTEHWAGMRHLRVRLAKDLSLHPISSSSQRQFPEGLLVCGLSGLAADNEGASLAMRISDQESRPEGNTQRVCVALFAPHGRRMMHYGR